MTTEGNNTEKSRLFHQKDFGYTQVKRPDELQVGKLYYLHSYEVPTDVWGNARSRNRDHVVKPVQIQSLRFCFDENESGEFRPSLEVVDTWGVAHGLFYLGLGPDKRGHWHQFAWLEDPRKPKPEKTIPSNSSQIQQ